jgi:hypothetical protein
MEVPNGLHKAASERGWAATVRRSGGLVLAVVLLVGLFSLPAALSATDHAQSAAIPLELVLAVTVLALWPNGTESTGSYVRRAAAGVLTVFLVLEALDAATRTVLGRPFVLVFDLPLVMSAIEFIYGTFGALNAILVGSLILASIPLVYVVIAACLRAAHSVARSDRYVRVFVVAVCSAAIVSSIGRWSLPGRIESIRIVSDQHLRDLASEARSAVAMLDDYSTFRAAGTGPAVSPAALAGGLDGADVLVFFLESYGRSAIETPRYGSVVVPSLQALQRTLDRHGFAAVSGWLESPTLGGQSWLAHATLLSGLQVDNQLRYKLLLSGERRTLVEAFNGAGYRTVLAEPAINKPWPEVGFYGFDRTYFSGDLGYAGPPYDWVTMPDQYTLHAFDRAERRRAAGPLFAVTVLISSHAPWTPIAEVVEDWSMIGDGRIFAAWADRGAPPRVVWRNRETIRRQYAMAMDYVIDVFNSYFRQFGDRKTLAILVGDHQPGPVVSGPTPGHDVPIHVISNNPDLLEPFRTWGLIDGMLPEFGGKPRPMSSFRDWFLTSFGAEEAVSITSASVEEHVR